MEYLYVYLYGQNKHKMKERTELRLDRLVKIEANKKLHKYGFSSLTALIIHLLRNWNEQNK